MRILDKPMSFAEAKSIADSTGFITGIIRVGLDTLIDNDLEGFLDYIGESLVERGSLLSYITYKAVGCLDGEILLEVSGNISLIEEAGFDNDDDSGG